MNIMGVFLKSKKAGGGYLDDKIINGFFKGV